MLNLLFAPPLIWLPCREIVLHLLFTLQEDNFSYYSVLWPYLYAEKRFEFTERLELTERAVSRSESERALLDVTSPPLSFSRCEAHYSLRDAVSCPQAYNWGKEVQVWKNVSALRLFDLLCRCAAVRSSSSGVRNSVDLVRRWTNWRLSDFSKVCCCCFENEVVRCLLFSIWERHLEHRWVMVIPYGPLAMRVCSMFFLVSCSYNETGTLLKASWMSLQSSTWLIPRCVSVV